MQQCGLCKNENLTRVIDLGNTPIAHEFSSTKEQAMSRHKYPMSLLVCDNCGMGQLDKIIDPKVLYSDYNFCFSTWKNQPHIEDECLRLKRHLTQGTIVEVGCNDGLFLTELSQFGDYVCIGVEPNKISSSTAKDKGFEVINKFFDAAVDCELANRDIDAVFARQVMEHIPNVDDFLISVNKLLKVGGLIGIEVPNTNIALTTGDVSCLWEEHVNPFTPFSLKVALEGFGFKVIEETTYQFSGEAVFMLAKKETNVDSFSLSQSQNISLYKKYSAKVKEYQKTLFAKIAFYKKQGYEVVLYGSGCRSSMIVHGLGLYEYIDHIVDDQAEKQGLYMSATRLAVKGLLDLALSGKYLFILSVNNENDIKVTDKISAVSFGESKIISAHSPKNILNELKRL